MVFVAAEHPPPADSVITATGESPVFVNADRAGTATRFACLADGHFAAWIEASTGLRRDWFVAVRGCSVALERARARTGDGHVQFVSHDGSCVATVSRVPLSVLSEVAEKGLYSSTAAREPRKSADPTSHHPHCIFVHTMPCLAVLPPWPLRPAHHQMIVNQHLAQQHMRIRKQSVSHAIDHPSSHTQAHHSHHVPQLSATAPSAASTASVLALSSAPPSQQPAAVLAPVPGSNPISSANLSATVIQSAPNLLGISPTPVASATASVPPQLDLTSPSLAPPANTSGNGSVSKSDTASVATLQQTNILPATTTSSTSSSRKRSRASIADESSAADDAISSSSRKKEKTDAAPTGSRRKGARKSSSSAIPIAVNISTTGEDSPASASIPTPTALHADTLPLEISPTDILLPGGGTSVNAAAAVITSITPAPINLEPLLPTQDTPTAPPPAGAGLAASVVGSASRATNESADLEQGVLPVTKELPAPVAMQAAVIAPQVELEDGEMPPTPIAPKVKTTGSRKGKSAGSSAGGSDAGDEGLLFVAGVERKCTACGTTVTPMWRKSSTGATLCNACGVKLNKKR
ncbi:hypothetical protein BC830DRAFT_583582 [Chytriomyces sp. MP71]|nr:hypothetical protein BC830DRAFT_583582 [Chytriomyces sp. MP71]